jgi:hypothetical protein
MNDEDFKQTVLDYFGMVAPRKHEEIMATLADIKAQNEANAKALDAKLGAIAAAQSAHHAAVDKALADLAATGAAGHAAVLDDIAIDNSTMAKKIDAIDAPITMAAMTEEITKAIAATPTPMPAGAAATPVV